MLAISWNGTAGRQNRATIDRYVSMLLEAWPRRFRPRIRCFTAGAMQGGSCVGKAQVTALAISPTNPKPLPYAADKASVIAGDAFWRDGWGLTAWRCAS